MVVTIENRIDKNLLFKTLSKKDSALSGKLFMDIINHATPNKRTSKVIIKIIHDFLLQVLKTDLIYKSLLFLFFHSL